MLSSDPCSLRSRIHTNTPIGSGQAGYDSGNRSDGIIRNIAMYFSTSFGGTTRLDSEGRTSSATTYIGMGGYCRPPCGCAAPY